MLLRVLKKKWHMLEDPPNDTVNGRNPAPVDVDIFIRFHKSQVQFLSSCGGFSFRISIHHRVLRCSLRDVIRILFGGERIQFLGGKILSNKDLGDSHAKR